MVGPSLSPSLPPHPHPSRSRKIRCDGAKPTCHNCTRRANLTCVYDPAPKRRGPDKTPGARQRPPGEALQESSTAVTSHRRRRDSAFPPPQRPLPTSASPLKQLSLVLDPQLADMSPFYTPAPPLPPGSSLPGSGPPVSDPLPVPPDGTLYRATTSQVLT